MHKWWWLGGAAFAAAVGGVLAFVMLGGPDRLETGDKLASISSLLIGAAGLVLAAVSLKVATRPQPVSAVEELARLVDSQWRLEARTRGLLHPSPLKTRWSTTALPVAAPLGEVLGPTPGARVTRLHGDVYSVASTWRGLPARQLVLIGAPGAGKTSLAVLFVRQLLATRAAGDPVPVLLNLAGWDPEHSQLDTWLAHRLTADYPQLTDPRFGKGAPARLLDHVIPVLDGLDEMPEQTRSLAIAAMNHAGDRPLVLTCRTIEYEATIAETRTPLGRAAVVELAPVTGAEAGNYLSAGQLGDRWAPVRAELAANPDGVLAKALSTPLMVFLARTAYLPPDTNPAELLTYPTSEEVESRLLDAYLPTVYRHRPGERYSPTEAGRWLGAIASRLTAGDAHELSLWSGAFTSGHDRASPPRRRKAVVSRRDHGNPLRLLVRPRQVVRALLMGVATCAATLFVAWVIGTVVMSEPPSIGFLFALPSVPKLLVLIGSLVAVFALLTNREVVGPTLTPATALGQDRAVAVVCLLLVALVSTLLSVGRSWPWWLSSYTLLIAGAWLQLLAFGSIWCRWQMVRARYALRGVLPWRLLTFLEDAHRRGVLRVVGTEYQFRHARLQDHLSRVSPA